MSEAKRPTAAAFVTRWRSSIPVACNPSGIALSIAEACREIREHENGRHQGDVP